MLISGLLALEIDCLTFIIVLFASVYTTKSAVKSAVAALLPTFHAVPIFYALSYGCMLANTTTGNAVGQSHTACETSITLEMFHKGYHR